jgi:hypothetical protein
MRLARNGRLIFRLYAPDIVSADRVSSNRSAKARFAGSLLRQSILHHHHSGGGGRLAYRRKPRMATRDFMDMDAIA